ncbi:class I SAM-dependent methyltransferase [Microvirga aerophila]|nr:class I SAM-dependent methyltransferase [Microvirga aerophila]
MMMDDLASRVERIEKQLLLAETYSVKAFWQALDRAYHTNLQTRDLRCIICEYTDKRSGFQVLTDQCEFGGGELERYQCPRCDCVFGAQKYLDLDESFVDLDYRLLYSRYSESDSSINEIRTFHSLRPQRQGVYLDWGCGGAWSPTISKLREGGWDVWGYEPSADVASAFVVNQRNAVSARFDGIFSNNVIEHFRDPIAQFKDFHSLLKDGGGMAHSSPCYEYRYSFTRFHTLFLLGKSPDVLAERTGFRVIDRVQEGEYINVVFART